MLLTQDFSRMFKSRSKFLFPILWQFVNIYLIREVLTKT